MDTEKIGSPNHNGEPAGNVLSALATPPKLDPDTDKQDAPPPDYNGEPLGQYVLSLIARILDHAGVPNVLWGDYLLCIYGVPLAIVVSTAPNIA